MKKDKVAFVRAQEFEDVDTQLAEAMEKLDAANSRILEVLSVEKVPVIDNAAPTPTGPGDADIPPMPSQSG